MPAPDKANEIKGILAAILAFLTALWGWLGWAVIIWVACFLLDYISGTAAARKNHEWSSDIAREGLWHKLGKGVPKNPEEALRWFRLAEEAGNTNARGQVDALMAEKARADALRGAAESGGGYVCTVCGHRMVGVVNKCPVCDSSRDHFKIVT